MEKSENLHWAFGTKIFIGIALLVSVGALLWGNFAFAQSYPNLAGDNWLSEQNQGCVGYIQQKGSELFFKMCDYTSQGRFEDGRTISGFGVRGTVKSDGTRIEWTNGNVWYRAAGSSSSNSSSLTVEYDTDRMYGDYIDYDLPKADFELCRSACAKDGKCKAYTYVKPGVQGSNARCWLKSSVPNASRSSCCISGVKN